MTTLLFGKESACTEDPAGHDRRTVLVPADVRGYLDAGFDVVVQSGLGEGIGYIDNQYEMEGARVEQGPECYAGKDLIVKLKGATAAEIGCMSPGTIMLTMAHLYCFPERTQQLAERQVKVIAMEGVRKTQEVSERFLAGIRAGARVKEDALGPNPHVHVLDSADQDYLNGLFRALMRNGRGPLSVSYLKGDSPQTGIEDATSNLCVTRSGAYLRTAAGELYDLNTSSEAGGDESMVAEELTKSGRAVGQTRQVGIGATRYGVGLFRKVHGRSPRAVVLGYGNVSMGAFEQLRTAGVEFTVLGRKQTAPDALGKWLRSADLVINGAETPGQSDYIVTDRHVDKDIRRGTVIVDLIGGTPYRRSPVEAFEWTTFLPDIHFEKDGRYFAGLWAWDMYYSMHDTTVNYSRMIKDLFTASDRYVKQPAAFVTDHAYAQQLGA
ncbi:hypothetical protein [Streptomyces sp. cmx-4-9]|uniref:hypothetical protein n=1 Tax=Streptomyces sp. cmx-4-9 TaxID=2790941 RepID=UPI00397E9B33